MHRTIPIRSKSFVWAPPPNFPSKFLLMWIMFEPNLVQMFSSCFSCCPLITFYWFHLLFRFPFPCIHVWFGSNLARSPQVGPSLIRAGDSGDCLAIATCGFQAGHTTHEIDSNWVMHPQDIPNIEAYLPHRKTSQHLKQCIFLLHTSKQVYAYAHTKLRELLREPGEPFRHMILAMLKGY